MGASFSNYLDLYMSISGASSTSGATRRWERQRHVRFGGLVEPWLEREVRPVPTGLIEVRRPEAPCSHSCWRSQATA